MLLREVHEIIENVELITLLEAEEKTEKQTLAKIFRILKKYGIDVPKGVILKLFKKYYVYTSEDKISELKKKLEIAEDELGKLVKKAVDRNSEITEEEVNRFNELRKNIVSIKDQIVKLKKAKEQGFPIEGEGDIKWKKVFITVAIAAVVVLVIVAAIKYYRKKKMNEAYFNLYESYDLLLEQGDNSQKVKKSAIKKIKNVLWDRGINVPISHISRYFRKYYKLVSGQKKKELDLEIFSLKNKLKDYEIGLETAKRDKMHPKRIQELENLLQRTQNELSKAEEEYKKVIRNQTIQRIVLVVTLLTIVALTIYWISKKIKVKK